MPRLRVVIGLFEDQDSALIAQDGGELESTPIKEVGFVAHIRPEDIQELMVSTQKPREMVADMMVLLAKESVMKSVNQLFKSRKLGQLLARASEAMKSVGRTAAIQHQNLPTDALIAMAKKAESDVQGIIKVLEGDDDSIDFEGLDWRPVEQKGGIIH